MEGTAELFAGFAERIVRGKGTQQEMMREGDYIEDGLIHCGKCKGKRQTRVKIPGGDGATITVPCICKCEAKAEEDRKKQEEARQELQRIVGCLLLCKKGGNLWQIIKQRNKKYRNLQTSLNVD